MSKVVVRQFAVSVDGYAAAKGQSKEEPFGPGGFRIVEWFFPTKVFQTMQGKPGGTTGIDNNFAEKSFENIGAWIMGRNMFAPSRGPWPEDGWRGWWGEEPVYHCSVFVLTHHPRPPLEMKGGTTFHFITDGIHSALERAKQAAQGKDVRVGGGANTVRQYLQAQLVDEMHLGQSPVLLGSGESLFQGLDLDQLGYQVVERVPGEGATHLIVRKK
ncbi:MAG: dihydrofolate reductase family protein [Deltaproteobacteria bacterium]